MEWNIEPAVRPPLQGDEAFIGLNERVEDFWRFAMPDLRVNNVRGWLAEFLVWRALGVERPVRIEWDQFDVLWEGVRIEVKSSGRLQNWGQKRLSSLLFTGLATHAWPLNTGSMADKRISTRTYTSFARIPHRHMMSTTRWICAIGASQYLRRANYDV
jgi:hypothetical protein